jgi:lipopolysaccharide export system permease protein
MLGGLIMSLGVILINELVVPIANERMKTHKRTKINKLPPIDYQMQNNLKYLGQNGYTYSIRTYDGKQKMIKGVTVLKFDEHHKIESRIDAVKAVWTDDQWQFKDGYIRYFSDSFEQRVEHFSTRTFPHMEEKPDDFSRRVKSIDEMNYSELRRYLQKLKRTGKDPSKALVELYTKISFPFVTFIIILLGAPLSADSRRSGLALGFGLSLLISFIYWGVLQVSKAYGIKGNVAPLLSAWIPNIVFMVIGGFLMVRIKK